jgi:hypothetical protein
MARTEIDVLLDMIDRGFDHKAWHGPTLRGGLRRVDVATAAWRPGAERHNIWEIAIHAAYWKYIVRRRLLGEKKGSFPLKGSNWFARPVDASADAWESDLKLLEQTHRALRVAVAELRPADLLAQPDGSKVNNFEMILGIAMHDVYHAGQIQLLKRLAAS